MFYILSFEDIDNLKKVFIDWLLLDINFLIEGGAVSGVFETVDVVELAVGFFYNCDVVWFVIDEVDREYEGLEELMNGYWFELDGKLLFADDILCF